MLLNNSPLKNTSEKLKSPQTSIKTLKIERKKDFKSFLKYVEKESKALEDIKLPSLNDAKNKKSSLLGSALGLGALGLLAFFAGGEGDGDPNDQPNKFDYFDPEAFKRTLNTQTRIASLSYTGMKAANFFDDGDGRQPRRMINVTPGGDLQNTKFGQFANQNMLFGEDYSPFKKRIKGSIVTDLLADIEQDIYSTDTSEEVKRKKIKKRLFNLEEIEIKKQRKKIKKRLFNLEEIEIKKQREKQRELVKVGGGDDQINYSNLDNKNSKGRFKDERAALNKITKEYSKFKKPNFFSGTSANANKTFSIDDPAFDLNNLIDSDEVESNLGNKAKRQVATDNVNDAIDKKGFYKKPQKNRFQKFFDTGIPRLFARGALTLLNIGGKAFQIEPLISPVLSPDAFEEGTMTSVMDVFGNLPGDPNFDVDSKGIYSDYIDVTDPRAIKEMKQIKINYLTKKMITGDIQAPNFTGGLNYNDLSIPPVNFQPPVEGNSDKVVPFILPEGDDMISSHLDSLILLELERY
tara:strand:- start:3914 stop:5473 length:1560 start_codon:yes stop_codon:yes gene_type:complete